MTATFRENTFDVKAGMILLQNNNTFSVDSLMEIDSSLY